MRATLSSARVPSQLDYPLLRPVVQMPSSKGDQRYRGPMTAHEPARTALALAAVGAAALALGVSAAIAAPAVKEFDVPTADAQPTDIANVGGKLWFVEQVGGKVGRVTPGAPPLIEEFTPPSEAGSMTPINGLQDITRGPDGNVWVSATNVVAKVPPDNPTGGIAYGGLGLADPRGLAAGPDGNVWVVDAGTDDVKRVTTGGALVGAPIPLGAGCGPRNIARGTDDNMWVTCFGNGKIVRIKGDGSASDPFTLAPGSTPWDITRGPDGKLWFTGQKHDVSSITTAGTAKPFTSKGLDPFGITVGPDNALWYAEFGDSTIGRVTTAGVTSRITGLTANSGPRYIAPGPSNTLWFTEQTANKIGRITGIVQPAKPPAKASFANSKSSVTVNEDRRFRYGFRAGKGLTGRATLESARQITVEGEKRKVTFAKRSFTVPADGRVALKIRLRKRKFEILQAKGTIRIRIRVVLKNAAGLTSTASTTFKLKAP
jgi:virginiamycin B lyase